MWVYEFFHVIVGILWIGLLYFFNLVQVQSMPKMVEAGAAKPYTQIILPKALFLFRHAALWTVITGIAYYMAGRGVVQGIPSGEIMIGMLLGIIMAGNVWFIIWPNQKKIIAGELEGDALAKAKRMAFLASRTNAWLSIPMLIGMLLGIIMAGNVWFIIWPNQKKIIAGELEGDALAKAKRMAFLASRTNAWLSIPMLIGMIAANHGGIMF